MMLVKKFKSADGVLKRAGSENARSKEWSYQVVRFRESGQRAEPGSVFCRSDYWQIEKVRRET